MFWAPLLVLGRILAETGSSRPTVDDPAVLLIKRHDVAIGCTPSDGGVIGDAGFGDGAVVEETIGPYQFVRAQPTSTAELAGWLDQLDYAYMTDDLDAVAPYISLGFHVVAIRVAADPGMSGALTPIALTWPGSELRIPAALGRGSVASTITVYIAAEQKYVLPGAHVPYAMDVSSGDMGFVTRNELMLDQSKPPATDPIALHTDNFQFEEIELVTEWVRVPVEVECESDLGCCRSCNTSQRTRLDWGVLALAVLVVLRRRRRR